MKASKALDHLGESDPDITQQIDDITEEILAFVTAHKVSLLISPIEELRGVTSYILRRLKNEQP